MSWRRGISSLMVAAGLAGCVAGRAGVTPKPVVASVKPLSDTSSGIVSNNGSSVIASDGAQVVSNNGGGLISDHGAGLIGKVKAPAGFQATSGRRVLDLAAQLPLAGVRVQLLDAAGKPLLDEQGQPLATTTDATGGYAFQVVPHDHHVVVQVDLAARGRLLALALKDRASGAAVDLDLVSTLADGYILDRYVQGRADAVTTLDRLPGDLESGTRQQAGTLLSTDGSPLPDSLGLQAVLATVDRLRAADAGFDAQLERVRRVLLIGGSEAASDGPALQAALESPGDLLAAPDGTLYVAATGQHLIRAVTPGGQIRTLAGNGKPGHADGPGPTAQFSYPAGLALGAAGQLYVLDSGTRTIRVVAPDGQVTTLGAASLPSSELPAGVPTPGDPGNLELLLHLFKPHEPMAVDGHGNVCFAFGDIVAALDPQGQPHRLAGSGAGTHADGPALSASFEEIRGLAPAPDGGLWIAESSRLRKLSADGQVSTVADLGLSFVAAGLAARPGGGFVLADRHGEKVVAVGTDGAQQPLAELPANPDPLLSTSYPLAVGADGTVFLADAPGNVIDRVAAGGLVAIAGSGHAGSGLDGSGDHVTFNSPMGLTYDAHASRLLVADTGNNLVRAIAPDGTVSTLAGSGAKGTGDGPARQASFSAPQYAAADAHGNVYVVDLPGPRVRRLAPDGTVSTPLDPTGADPAYPDAYFTFPGGLAIAPDDTVYVACTETLPSHDTRHVILRFNPQPAIFASAPGELRDLAFDPAGNLLAADPTNHAIRRIDPTGQLTTPYQAAEPQEGADDLLTACSPYAVAADAAALYVLDRYHGCVKRVGADGKVTVLLDGLKLPMGLALDGHGGLYVSDADDNQVRFVQLP